MSVSSCEGKYTYILNPRTLSNFAQSFAQTIDLSRCPNSPFRSPRYQPPLMSLPHLLPARQTRPCFRTDNSRRPWVQHARRADLRVSTPHACRPLPMQVLNTYRRNAEDSPTTRQTPTLCSLLMTSAHPVSHPTYLRIQKRFGHEPG